MHPSKLIGEIIFCLVNLSINDLALIDDLVQMLSKDTSGNLADKIRGLITATPPLAPAPPSPTAISAEERAQLEQDAGFFKLATELAPNDADALGILKETYIKLGQRDEELATREKLVKAYEDDGRMSEAILEREALLEIRGKASPPAEISREERAQLERTVAMFEEVTVGTPNDYMSLRDLQNAYVQLGQDAKALATWRKIVRAYLNLGLQKTALHECEAILREFSSDPDTLSLLREATG